MTASPLPHFTLTVVTSADGFIARAPDDAPYTWASPEEQTLFFEDIAAADWCIMGRNTHEMADRPDRRRIVFSSGAGASDWRRATQVWLNPAQARPQELAGLVGERHPFQKGLILGGTRVHDWFLTHDAIDRIHLTVEPVRFGAGLPLFSGQIGAADQVLADLGFAQREERALNNHGTRYMVWERG